MKKPQTHDALSLQDRGKCQFCRSKLAEIASPTECLPCEEGFDVRDYLQVYIGGGVTLPFEEAAIEYLRQHYPEAGKIHYSLPSGYILKNSDFQDLLRLARKELENPQGKDVDVFEHKPDYAAVAAVVNRAKDICGSAPSLVVADYEFSRTFNRAISELPKQQQKKLRKERHIPKLETGDHDVYLSYPSGDTVYNVFFQIKKTSLDVSPRNIYKRITEAMNQCEKDSLVLKTMCGPFIRSNAVILGFPTFPFIERRELQKFLKCEFCPWKILTSDDLQRPYDLQRFLQKNGVTNLPSTGECSSIAEKHFYDIFSLYICASSSVDVPRTHREYFRASDAQMEKTLCILTPEQKKLVYEGSASPLLLMVGGSGTGKTLILKEKAKRLATEDGREVIVVNLAGGLLTEDFHRDFQGKEGIRVVDGREEGMEENMERLKSFLKRDGSGKHILIDEVPVTLGFQGIITAEALSDHWRWIPKFIKNPLQSITISFRPNDQSYSRDFSLLDVRPGGHTIHILERVKRNTRNIADLFLAIGNYSRQIFISSERTQEMDLREPGGKSLPVLFPIPSCYSLHPGKCREEMTCSAMRASFAIHHIHTECSMPIRNLPIFVVVDDKKKKASLVNILTSLYDSLPVIFLDDGQDTPCNDERPESDFDTDKESGKEEEYKSEEDLKTKHIKDFWSCISDEESESSLSDESDQFDSDASEKATRDQTHEFESNNIEDCETDEACKFRGRVSSDGLTPVVVVTEDEFKGCHLKNITIVVDLPHSRWKNYIRVASATDDTNILVVEEEELTTGKFSQLLQKIPGWKITKKNFNRQDLNEKLDRALEENEGKPIDVLRSDIFSCASCPVMEAAWDAAGGREEEDTDKLLTISLIGIFGYPATGKSFTVHNAINVVLQGRARVRIVHCGSDLSQELCREQWRGEVNVEVVHCHSRNITSLQDILPHGDSMKQTEVEEEEGCLSVLVVEDCPMLKDLEKEIPRTVQQLKAKHLKLILAFKLHSSDAPEISVERMIDVLKENPDSTAITLRSPSTDSRFLIHITRNEAPSALILGAKSLFTSATPGAIVLGPPVQYVKCLGNHGGYLCEGETSCGPYIKNSVHILSSFLKSVVTETTPEDETHVLVSDEALLKSLNEALSDGNRIRLTHPRDFRGCENSTIVTVNISDDWLLEVISRSKTQLIIIDCIQEHQDLWRTMLADGRVQPRDIPVLQDRSAFLLLDDDGKFLKVPTWDEIGKRVGEEAVNKGDFLDEDTGSFLKLAPDYFNGLDDCIPSSSSPFYDWGYVQMGGYGVPLWGDNEKVILGILREKGVEWVSEEHPPVPLKTRSGGFLESLSLSLTGTLLHLSLLQACAFLPEKGKGRTKTEEEDVEPSGILIFSWESTTAINVLPVVPLAKRKMWMDVEKLPFVYQGDVSLNLRQIQFRGRVDVSWQADMVPLLWALDRLLAELTPLTSDELNERRNRVERQ
ncbi:unnamed protein product [Darwinula stevensoni]|uniref:Uncharacterized protein n=1 Tax=Darwinula stevensoni TaxID=69355 RepID=A0A7R8XAQ8_9CRUS|nr:unnamed protein product [Darwinula stevensoni]CAG0892146.1 unnamed protein product [Darwinula stevensoni]